MSVPYLDGVPVPTAHPNFPTVVDDDKPKRKPSVETSPEKSTPVETNDLPKSEPSDDTNSDTAIIITGADAARHLLPLRDDGDPTVTFRSLLLGTILACFEATMSQIYTWKPTFVEINGTFITLIAYFLGNAWAAVIPRGDRLEARWRERGGEGTPPLGIRIAKFVNGSAWGLKEHAITTIMATSASAACGSVEVFAAQGLFYDAPPGYATVILSIISIGLFGYGVAGFVRPVGVFSVDAVYWSTLPTVKMLQGLHWESAKSSTMRCFWYGFGGMATWQVFPSYIFPMLNAISVPCIASQGATGEKGALLTNLFGGSLSNEGLGWFSISLDWQYITSFNTSLPLVLQSHMAVGYIICGVAMLGIYYSNVWGSRVQPFMSTRLRTQDGGEYNVTTIFTQGVLDHEKLAEQGLPALSGSFVYSMFMANTAIGALITHCMLFWGKGVIRTFKDARRGLHSDRHHAHMVIHYKETPWWWYAIVLVISFTLGLVVVLTQPITLSAKSYIISLLLGSVVAPFSIILYSRFGTGIFTDNLSKMLAGALIPEKPIGNMYFAAWSNNVITNSVYLSNSLKMGEYLKIPPQVMFLTQIYATVVGGFVNYFVMVFVVSGNRELLRSEDGNAIWSGASVQSYNTTATSWALAKYLYFDGLKYSIVPYGILLGIVLVSIHKLVTKTFPNKRIGGFSLSEDLNLPQLIQYAGFIPHNASQTCVLTSQVLAGFFTQFYLRNYKPRIFKDYSYLVTGAFDGASLMVAFVLTFAVFGVGGPAIDFPKWWGNNEGGNLDLCPKVSQRHGD
ncbi:OPT oligopeptide transporter [Immersiella caudata]|uniref:OPT oligopeptide transporter n=1 Tax=Immersiella caudata TaxID=314043 RepID=A0AA39U4M7_9PEZI|nr:OPT oligopeptide transporter [Immersiella caudata]